MKSQLGQEFFSNLCLQVKNYQLFLTSKKIVEKINFS